MWDVSKSVEYLNRHAEPGSVEYCARYVKNAISAGEISAHGLPLKVQKIMVVHC